MRLKELAVITGLVILVFAPEPHAQQAGTTTGPPPAAEIPSASCAQLDDLQAKLKQQREVGDRVGEVITLNNIGLVYSHLGQPLKALDYFNQVLPIVRQLGDRAGEAKTLNNIGLVYSHLGQLQKALDYFNQALPIGREVGDRRGEACGPQKLHPAVFQRGVTLLHSDRLAWRPQFPSLESR